MPSPRLPRFQRVRPSVPIELAERDRQIIRLIHRHRFLRSSHIISLIGSSQQQILRRLQLLYHHGYLERPRAQIDYYHKGGSRPIVYGLGSKSDAFLRQELRTAYRPLPWGEKNRAVGRIFLEHALLASEVMVALELACRRRDDVRLIFQDQLETPNNASFRWNVQLNGKTKLGIVPDRVFALEFINPHGEEKRAYFFLEADRGTMPVIRKNLSQTSFYRKLLAYEATWTQGLHESRFGFHRFRVLTVTKSNSRVESLVEACQQLKQGHGLFLFSTQALLENPAELLSQLWATGRLGEKQSLLD